MQSSDRVLARRYAQAYFESAADRKEEEKARKELTEAYQAVLPRIDYYKHPMMGATKQKNSLKEALGPKAGPRTLRFLELLIEKKRFALLPYIVNNFGKLLDEHQGVMRAHVKTASDLSEAEKEKLAKKLAAFTGKSVAIETKIAPELLGGVVIRIGDWVLDGSLQGQLRRLKQEFTKES